MKVRIEIDDSLEEDEVTIKCKELNQTIKKVQQSISNISQMPKLIFYKNDIEYYLNLNDILFFETSENSVEAHTEKEVYKIKYRLYELEEILLNNFVRVSKSTILNVNQIYSINRNLTSSSLVQFYKSYKQVYVSRNYNKILKQRLEERRNYES